MTYILIQGIVVGSLYALIAIGPSLVYGLMGVLDVASAAALTLGAYLLLVVFQASGSVLLGVAAALVLTGAAGWVFQKSLYVPILDRGPIVTLITSIGVYICADELFRLVFGPLQQSLGIQTAIPDLHIAGVEVTGINLLIIAIGVGLLLLTWLVLTRTRYGVVWRAVAQDRDIASAVGIDSKKVIGGVFVIGYALSALAGILYALKYDSVIPTMGDVPAYKMLAIIILGGLGSPLGTIAAAFLIGLVETAVVAQFGFVVPRDAIAFAALVLVLLIRPQGLIPSRVVRA
ncbi:branched-chain amino acid transport system permease protein [Aquamicrobium terrae]